jgi:hypothetical protein
MTAAGWLFMGLSWATLLVLAAFCYRRILRGKW